MSHVPIVMERILDCFADLAGGGGGKGAGVLLINF